MKFNESMSEEIITPEDELVVRDIFRDLEEEWDLLDIRPSLHGGRRDNKFINYLFFGPDFKPTSERTSGTIYFPSNRQNLYYNRDLMAITEILNHNSKFHMNVEKDYLGIYFDLSGPNDFFTIRKRFLDDVEIMSNRIQEIAYVNCITRIGRYDSNKLILFITK